MPTRRGPPWRSRVAVPAGERRSIREAGCVNNRPWSRHPSSPNRCTTAARYAGITASSVKSRKITSKSAVVRRHARATQASMSTRRRLRSLTPRGPTPRPSPTRSQRNARSRADWLRTDSAPGLGQPLQGVIGNDQARRRATAQKLPRPRPPEGVQAGTCRMGRGRVSTQARAAGWQRGIWRSRSTEATPRAGMRSSQPHPLRNDAGRTSHGHRRGACERPGPSRT